jgi:hypothetical protein
MASKVQPAQPALPQACSAIGQRSPFLSSSRPQFGCMGEVSNMQDVGRHSADQSRPHGCCVLACLSTGCQPCQLPEKATSPSLPMPLPLSGLLVALQATMLLSALGVADSAFLALQDRFFQSVLAMTEDSETAFKFMAANSQVHSLKLPRQCQSALHLLAKWAATTSFSTSPLALAQYWTDGPQWQCTCCSGRSCCQLAGGCS